MSWFSADSTSEQEYAPVAATDQATAVGRGGQVAAPGSIAVGTRGQLNTGPQIGRVSGDVTIGDGGEAAREMAGLFADTVQKGAAGQAALVDKVLQTVTGLAETTSTEGENLKLKVIWWAIIAGAGLGAVWLFMRR